MSSNTGLIPLPDFKESDFNYDNGRQDVENPRGDTLWKYMSLEHALDTILNERLWMANPKEWTDPYERLFIDATYKREGEEKGKSFDEMMGNEQLFCTCFTTTCQNDAQWKMYNNNDIAVMIGFDALKLFNALRQSVRTLYIGKAEYVDGPWYHVRENPDINAGQSEEERKLKLLSLMLRKRINFKYEQEVRLMYLQKKKQEDKYCKGIPLAVPKLRDCVRRVRLAPELGDHASDALKYVFQYIFKNGAKSSMEKAPPVEISQSTLLKELKKREIIY